MLFSTIRSLSYFFMKKMKVLIAGNTLKMTQTIDEAKNLSSVEKRR